MSQATANTIDERRLKRARSRAAATYDGSAVLQREVERRMLERLELVRLPEGPIIDIGCATGSGMRALAQRYPKASIVGVDPSLEMLRRAQGAQPLHRRLMQSLRGKQHFFCATSAEYLPFASRTFALAWSNLFVHWAADPERLCRELLGTLMPGGLLMFSCLGPDTLQELKRAFDAAGRPPSVHRFMDMHDLGDLLVHAGFADPVMDMEYITLTFSDLRDLAHDLRSQGATYCGLPESRPVLTRNQWLRLIQAYEPMRRDGKLPTTFEIVYGHAWKPQHGPRKTAEGLDVVRIHRPARSE